MDIITCCTDSNIFREFLTDRGTKPLSTWFRWFACLRAMYGLPLGANAQNTIHQVTKRNPDRLPRDGFRSVLALTGRRSGKSRMAAVIAVFEAMLANNESKLSGGETGVVALISVSKLQAKILRNYVSEILSAPMLAKELVNETREGFLLSNGIEIRILAGDFRSVRGFTIIAAILDEIAFYGLADENKIKSDEELVRALQPAMITTNGRLIAITSPYSRKGWVFKTYQKHFGKDTSSKTLVINCGSKVLNPTLPQAVIDEAMAEDPASARAEYFAEFRSDIAEFISRDAIEALVIKGRQSLMYVRGRQYYGFVDMSGGRSDDHALAIAHKENQKVIIDFVKRYQPGTSPNVVVADMCVQLRNYSISRVHGDRYGAEWVASSFVQRGIRYANADRNKSEIYLELLPRIGSSQVEFLDNDVLVNQLASLQRTTRSGGRDLIDHPPQAHDDLANAVAGVSCVAATFKRVVGALPSSSERNFFESGIYQ